MARKLALKRLTASDLTLFKWHYVNHQAGKQKAFNLDAQILVGEFFPYLGEPFDIPQPRFPLDLYLFGPGGAPAYNLQRKILKQQKNWRLNGELIDGPEEDSQRYNPLKPGDFAFFEFYGDTEPKTAKVLLIAQDVAADAAIHVELNRLYREGSMWTISESEILHALDRATPSASHPLNGWVVSDAIEDAVLGGAEGRVKINARRAGRGMSPEEFLLARKALERVGLSGEEFLNDYLSKLVASAELEGFEWTSSSNVISPFDFKLAGLHGESRVVDAKSTSGAFSNPIHISLNELYEAVEGREPYDIYRLYEVTETSAKLRIAENVGPALRAVLSGLSSLPHGVKVDTISVQVTVLPFSEEEIFLQAESGGSG